MSKPAIAEAIIPWLFVWSAEEAALVLGPLDFTVFRELIDNYFKYSRADHQKVMRRLKELYHQKPFRCGHPVWGKITPSNATDAFLLHRMPHRRRKAANIYLESILDSEKKLSPWSMLAALRHGGTGNPLCIKVANHVLSKADLTTQVIFSRGHEFNLCVDAESFRRITFLYSVSEERFGSGLIGRSRRTVFRQATEVCPNEASKWLHFYEEYLDVYYFRDLLTRIEIPTDLSHSIVQKLIKTDRAFQDTLPDRNKVLPANLKMFDDLTAAIKASVHSDKHIQKELQKVKK